jgi:hypothetical protein
MNQETTKLEALISQFKNGEERYRKSALVNQTINVLLMGVDPVSVIDNLISIIEVNQKSFEEYVINNPVPPRIIKPISNE